MNPKYLQKGAIYDAEFHLKVRRYIPILYYARSFVGVPTNRIFD